MTPQHENPSAWALRMWGSARTLEGVGDLTALWLEGTITDNPSYGHGGPDSETAAIITPLAAFNRSGFVTENSQPGTPMQDDSTQRACVSGFCTREVAETITAACLATELVCLVNRPGAIEAPYVPVTIDEGRAFTWEGMPTPAESIAYGYGHALSDDAVEALSRAWKVCIIDPVWGRNDLLWPTVEAALAGPPATGALPPFET